jgi:hypothetical protein
LCEVFSSSSSIGDREFEDEDENEDEDEASGKSPAISNGKPADELDTLLACAK